MSGPCSVRIHLNANNDLHLETICPESLLAPWTAMASLDPLLRGAAAVIGVACGWLLMNINHLLP